MSEQRDRFVPYRPGIGAYVLACVLGAVVAFALSTWWLGLSFPWMALLVGALFAALGALTGENIGDALMFSLIVAVVVSVVLAFVPVPGWLRIGVVPLATGLCTGKLVMGICIELFK